MLISNKSVKVADLQNLANQSMLSGTLYRNGKQFF